MARAARGTAVAVAAAALAVCSPRPERPRERVVIALAVRPHAALVHLALAHGDFAAEGLDVEVLRVPHGKVALTPVFAGKADLATSAETPIALAALEGRRAPVLATIGRRTGGSLVFAHARAPISSVADLAGRPVGVTLGTTSDYFLDAALVRAEVRVRDVKRVHLEPAAMPDALRRGEVEAVAALPPFSDEIRAALGGELLAVAGTAPAERYNLVASPALAARPELAERVLRAVLRAERRLRRDPAASLRTVAAALGADPAALAGTWGELAFDVHLDQSLLVLLEQVARWALRSGPAPAGDLPDLRGCLEPGPLRALAPSAVRLLW